MTVDLELSMGEAEMLRDLLAAYISSDDDLLFPILRNIEGQIRRNNEKQD